MCLVRELNPECCRSDSLSTWVLKNCNFSHPCIVFASRLTVTLWQGDRNLIKHHSFCAAHRCPRFRWHELIWIIHWGGIVTSFQATAVSAICWAVRALGGSDRALVWRGNPCFECPPAGNLNEFKLHLSVLPCLCVQVLFSCFTTPLFCNFVSLPNGKWSTMFV
jgi:hypothetical protein